MITGKAYAQATGSAQFLCNRDAGLGKSGHAMAAGIGMIDHGGLPPRTAR